uniref:INTEIN_C_TER domain-containing protein n=1 Tax=Macrostomum lignano TaxID=282301 RepID=A0A1I8H932_9PLAT
MASMSSVAALCTRRFLSTAGQRRVTSLSQISMQANLEEKFKKFPIPKENLQFRLATLADKAEVLKIEPDIHYGLDYMQDYYDEIIRHDDRYGIVAVDTVNNKILTFAYAIVNEGGRNLSFGGGRTVAGVRDFGLMSYATRALLEHLQPRLHSLAGCCGVYSLPVYNRKFFENRQHLLKVVLHNQQLGFECTADYWENLATRFAASEPRQGEPVPVSDPVQFLSSESVCSSTENRLFKPDQHILIAKESLPGLVPTGEVTGVSIANWTSVPVGGLHLVLNIYCRTESDAVGHLAGQLRTAVSRLRLSDPQRHRLYISAFVPSHLLFNETLSGLRLHPLLRDLPHSYSPKLACDARIGAWSPGAYV